VLRQVDLTIFCTEVMEPTKLIRGGIPARVWARRKAQLWLVRYEYD